jgi:protein-L-isoaspartate(D-aspartate) O-methyltransferase
MSDLSRYYWTGFGTAPIEAIENDIRLGGIKNERVIRAALQFHPADFRPWELAPRPALAAGIAESLQPRDSDTVLEVGTGTGYLTAILASLARKVITFEIDPLLAAFARASLKEHLKIDNVRIVEGDGSAGYAEEAPYNCICVSGTVQTIPPALLDQLADGGRLFVPLGGELQLITRGGEGLNTRVLGPGGLTPLQGSYGAQGRGIIDHGIDE